MSDQVISIFKNNGLKVMLVTKEHTLNEVLTAFEHVLRGSGYSVKWDSLSVDEEASD